MTYAHWGKQLGEDQVENMDERSLQLTLKGLLATVQQPVCLLGHYSDPSKCHRLRLCQIILGWGRHEVWHLYWADHMRVTRRQHQEVVLEAKERSDFFANHF